MPPTVIIPLTMGGRGGRVVMGRIGWLGSLDIGGADEAGTDTADWGGGGGRVEGGSGGWTFFGGCVDGMGIEPDIFGIAGPIFSFSSSGLQHTFMQYSLMLLHSLQVV